MDGMDPATREDSHRLYLESLDKRAFQGDLNTFKASQLSSQTRVRWFNCSRDGVASDFIEDDDNLDKQLLSLQQIDHAPRHSVVFVNKFIVKDGAPVPPDHDRLQLSRTGFDLLVTALRLPPALLSMLANRHQAISMGCPGANNPNGLQFDCWFRLPIRVLVRTSSASDGDQVNPPFQRQMNPLRVLHLDKRKLDVLPSSVVIYLRQVTDSDRFVTLVINLQHGKWGKLIEEPVKHVKACFDDNHQRREPNDPFTLPFIYLRHASRLWDDVLNCCNDQLIAYEDVLLRQEDSSEQSAGNLSTELNRALRCIAAHLERYRSELDLLLDIIEQVSKWRQQLIASSSDTGNTAISQIADTQLSGKLEQLRSITIRQRSFRTELEHKTESLLALIIARAQVFNDRQLIQNGEAMQKILKATETEMGLSRQLAIQSQAIAEEMRKDSGAMKTIATMTVFFLPGTTYAAVLSMPFFTQSSFMRETSSFWIWLVMTVPSTALLFVVFIWRKTWRRSYSHRQAVIIDPEAATHIVQEQKA